MHYKQVFFPAKYLQHSGRLAVDIQNIFTQFILK